MKSLMLLMTAGMAIAILRKTGMAVYVTQAADVECRVADLRHPNVSVGFLYAPPQEAKVYNVQTAVANCKMLELALLVTPVLFVFAQAHAYSASMLAFVSWNHLWSRKGLRTPSTPTAAHRVFLFLLFAPDTAHDVDNPERDASTFFRSSLLSSPALQRLSIHDPLSPTNSIPSLRRRATSSDRTTSSSLWVTGWALI